MARSRYHAKPIKQTLKFNGKLIGCTDTSFAMCVDAATLGGCIVTEKYVRSLSSEAKPDPESPGLNLDQLEGVAQKLRVEFTKVKGGSRANFKVHLRQNRRIVAQLWYAGIGGTPIGHAVYVESISAKGMARIVDPMKGVYSLVPEGRLFDAMETFAKKAGVPKGLLYGATRGTQWLSANQAPAK